MAFVTAELADNARYSVRLSGDMARSLNVAEMACVVSEGLQYL